jgi:hypothetical protein
MVDFVEGDRIRLVKMNDDPDPIPSGTCGTVIGLHQLAESNRDTVLLCINWDVNRSLSVLLPIDQVVKL